MSTVLLRCCSSLRRWSGVSLHWKLSKILARNVLVLCALWHRWHCLSWSSENSNVAELVLATGNSRRADGADHCWLLVRALLMYFSWAPPPTCTTVVGRLETSQWRPGCMPPSPQTASGPPEDAQVAGEVLRDTLLPAKKTQDGVQPKRGTRTHVCCTVEQYIVRKTHSSSRDTDGSSKKKSGNSAFCFVVIVKRSRRIQRNCRECCWIDVLILPEWASNCETVISTKETPPHKANHPKSKQLYFPLRNEEQLYEN